MQPSRAGRMGLWEHYLLVRAMLGAPGLHTALQGAQQFIRILLGIKLLEPLE